MDNNKINRWLGFGIFSLVMALIEITKDDKNLLNDVSKLGELNIEVEDVDFETINNEVINEKV